MYPAKPLKLCVSILSQISFGVLFTNVTLYIQYFHYIAIYLIPHLYLYPSYQLALILAYIN